jgi:hypothetical protein
VSHYNDRIISEFRENGGTVTTGHGSGLVLLHSIGAKSGAERVSPVLAIPEGDGWLIAHRRVREDWRSPQSLFGNPIAETRG